MAKNKKISKDEQEKADMEKMQKRVESLLPAKADIPASISIQQAEELKVRVRELEAQLAQQAEEAQKKSISVPENRTPDQSGNKATQISHLKLSRSAHTAGTNEASNQLTAQAEEKTKQFGLWAAGIFTAVGLAFLGYSIYIVVAVQQGRFDLSDKILMPMAATMFIAGIISYGLIQRGRHSLGVGILYFSEALIPPVLAALLLKDFGAVAISYIVLLALIMIGLVMPKTSRTWAIIAALAAISIIIGIEYWNPDFRVNTGIGDFVYIITALAGAGLLVFLLRRAWGGNIRLKVITSFTIVALLSTSIVGAVVYISYRNQVREDIRQRLLNIASITATQIDGDLHATLQTPEDMQTEAYKQMMAEGDEIIATDPTLKYSYTMRMNDQGQIYFILDSRQADDTERVDIGTVYEEPSETLLSYFKTPDHPIVEKEIHTDEFGSVLSAFAPFYRADGSLEGIFGVDIAADKVLAQERAVLILIVETTFAAMVIVTLIGLFLGNVFVQPIVRLSSVAQRITSGEFDARAKVETTDEVGNLATAFNTMTSQLQETLQGLEQRVADRTHDLELASEVGSTIAEKVENLTAMLTDATEMIRSRFNLYYTQVYLLDPSSQTLTLRAGTGNVGQQLLRRGHHLLVSAGSLNGRAISEKKPVIVADTQKSGSFLPNPLLPNTRSEMAIPLLVGDKVLGVLDMQSETPDALNEENIAAFQVLAGQLSVAIQNATLFAQSEESRKQVEANVRQITATGWQDFLNGNDRGEKIGYVFDQAEVKPMERKSKARSENVLSVPITVTGASVGAIEVAQDEREWTSRETQIIQSTAEKLSQHIEGLRLLAQAEKYRQEAEQTTRRLTREGWENYVQTHDTLATGYSFDPNEVKSEKEEAEIELSSALSLPLTVRDEAVGELFIQGLEPEDSESISLANAVIERLGSHIESLRLSMQTEQALATTQEFAKREQSLRQITSAVRGSTDPATILRTAVRELGTLLGRKTVVRMTTEKNSHIEHPAELPNTDGGNK